jgi:hypothetical protein
MVLAGLDACKKLLARCVPGQLDLHLNDEGRNEGGRLVVRASNML